MFQIGTSAVITRSSYGDQGTFGVLRTAGVSFYSGELPWRGNAPQVSCVPVGKYTVKWAYSPRLRKYTYRLIGVPGRSGVLIHPANFIGDVKLGFRCQLAGCIALGEKVGFLEGQRAILLSRPAVRGLEELMQEQPFVLEVRDA